jgi:iron complex transport system substrate-binding protein
MVSEGSGTMTINDSVTELSFGCLLFAHARAKVFMTSTDSAGLHLYNIQFDQYKRVQDTREQLLYHNDCEGLPENGLIATHRIAVLLQLCKALIEVHGQADDSSHSFEEQKLLLELLHEVLIARPQLPYYNQETPIQKAVHYIRENYNTKLQREYLAHLTGYHPHYLSKQFGKETGQSISDYILQLRMDKAKELLSITSSHINEIAAKVGYQDALYFSRKFKQATGMHPTEYRQNPKRIVAFQYIGTLLALGITPIGVESHMMHYSQQLKGELTGVAGFEEWDSSKVLLLQPDLIVAPSYFRAELLQQLRTIAPVIVQSWDAVNPIERVRSMGQLLGKQQEAEAWIQQFNQLAEQHKHKLSEILRSNETVGAYEIADGIVYALCTQDRGAYALYEVLGLPSPDAIKRHVIESGKSKMIASGELSAFAADHMVVSIYEERGMEKTNRLLASDAWRKLPAVREGRAYIIPVTKCFANDGVSLQKLTDMLVHMFFSRQDQK